MRCEICESKDAKIIFNNRIRKGSFGNLTDNNVKIYQCKECGVIWHEKLNDNSAEYYQSQMYRNDMGEEGVSAEYYLRHDKEVLEKLQYTGTDIFRDRIVADIGCGGGSYLDFLKGVAKSTIGIEPTENYRNGLIQKGHTAYSFAQEALLDYADRIDIVTSFDVIEHVDNPLQFMQDIKSLCSQKGQVIIGTPTEQTIMRSILGEEYDSFLFSYQHPWIFNKESLIKIFKDAGFEDIRVEYKQRYGLGNLIAWLKNHKPLGNIKVEYITEIMDALWIKEAEGKKLSDYLIVYASVQK